MTAPSYEDHEVDEPTVRKAVGAAAMGNLVEWFDYGIYSYVVAYITFDQSAKEVIKSGPVIKARKTGVPTYSPWWTTMSNAASQAQALEKELCISPRERGAGAKVVKKQTRTTGSARFLKQRG